MSNFNLSVVVPVENMPIVEISVFNWLSESFPMKKGRGPAGQECYTIDLPKGVYTVRASLINSIKDITVILDTNKYLEFQNFDPVNKPNDPYIVKLPSITTSVLFNKQGLNNYPDSHEHYTGPVMDWSSRDTGKSKRSDSSTSVFIFLRYSSRDRFSELLKTGQRPMFHLFRFTNDQNKNTVKLSNRKKVISEDQNTGFCAYSAEVQGGLYYLFYGGNLPRQIPIYVYQGWHTQVFLTLDEEPRFDSLRVFFSPVRRFNPDNTEGQYIDILLGKLQASDFTLNKELIDIIAYGKFHSPMLGILGAYIYLQSNELKDDQLFQNIINNLRNYILPGNDHSPDLTALQLLATLKFKNWALPKEKITLPPTLRAGFSALRKMAESDPTQILPFSLNDYISQNLFGDSAFTTFAPIKPADVQLTDTSESEVSPPKILNRSIVPSEPSPIHLFRETTDGLFNNPEIDFSSSGNFSLPDLQTISKNGSKQLENYLQPMIVSMTKRTKAKKHEPIFQNPTMEAYLHLRNLKNIEQSLARIIGDEIVKKLKKKFAKGNGKNYILNDIVTQITKKSDVTLAEIASNQRIPIGTVIRVLCVAVINLK